MNKELFYLQILFRNILYHLTVMWTRHARQCTKETGVSKDYHEIWAFPPLSTTFTTFMAEWKLLLLPTVCSMANKVLKLHSNYYKVRIFLKRLQKVWRKSWQPFRIYQLSSTANADQSTQLAVLVKGQLISKCLFGAIILTKKPTIFI